MKLVKSVLAAAAALAASASFAQVTGNTGGLNNSANFLALSAANVSGGAIYSDVQNFPATAARPTSVAPAIATVGNWVAAGPSTPTTAAGMRH